MSTLDLKAYLEKEGRAVRAALEAAVDGLDALLPPRVADAVRHGLLSGGKGLRPVLCVTAYRACGGGSGDRVYDAAAALELIHAYSLMHDDLPSMDDAALRRGRPTTHTVHGEDVTMRAGAAMIPAAALQALRGARALGCDEVTSRRAAAVVVEAAGAGGMVGGQWLDLMGEGRSLTAEELADLHRRKTGALLTASVVLGGVLAGVEPPVLSGLERYGRAIGLAFQIADDILDATQSAGTLGKNPSDAVLGKSTYVSLFGLDEARRRAADVVAEAHGALQDAGVDAPALHALADYIVERDH